MRNPKERKFGIAFSGGADSTCLLHLIHALDYQVVAFHVNHGLREESADEEKKCIDFCRQRRICIDVKQVNLLKYSKDHRLGIEEAGRKIRYNFFEEAQKRFSCDFTLTAHTLNDRVETILFNLTRGTGLQGLIGIPEINGSIIRPLLSFTREQILTYCHQHQLTYFEDPMNQELEYSRSRIRHRVLPELKKINSNCIESIARFGDLIAKENQFLDEEVGKVLHQAEQPLNNNLQFLTKHLEACFAIELLQALPIALLRRALRMIANRFGATLDFSQMHQLTELLLSSKKGAITAEKGGLIFECSEGALYIRLLTKSIDYSTLFPIPGEISLPEGCGRFLAKYTNVDCYKRDPCSLEVCMDQGAIVGELFIRPYSPGDKMVPLGFSSTQKIKKMFSKSKLTKTARKFLPLLCDQEGPIWIPGCMLSERVKITQKTKKILELSIVP